MPKGSGSGSADPFLTLAGPNAAYASSPVRNTRSADEAVRANVTPRSLAGTSATAGTRAMESATV
jgi:hypothetical protein